MPPITPENSTMTRESPDRPHPQPSRRTRPAGARSRAVAAFVLAPTLSFGSVGCSSTNPAAWFLGDAAAQATPAPSRDGTLDAASAALNRQQPGEALRALAPLLDELGPADPQALELAGKAHLRLGRFDEAADRFEDARRVHEHPGDRRRAADLAALARGFRAYADTDFAAAREQWVQIDHPGLRRSAFAAFEDPPQSVALTALDGAVAGEAETANRSQRR